MGKIPKLPRKPRRKKTDRQKQIDRLDKLFREIIYAKYNKTCQMAGKDSVRCGGNIQCAHIISRGNYRLRWDVKNAVCLCAGHHVYYTHMEYLWWDVVKEQWPDLWAYLEPIKGKLGSTKKQDLNLIEVYLKQIMETL